VSRAHHTFLPLTIQSPSEGRLTVVKAAGPWHTDAIILGASLSRAFICSRQQTAKWKRTLVQAGKQHLSSNHTYMAHTCQSALVMLQSHANCI
jgi:hypothetical protein